MNIRLAEEQDYLELARMRWLHGEEDDTDYGEHNLEGVDKEVFIGEFAGFLKKTPEYKAFVAEENGVLVSAMFVYMVPKVPKPNGNARCISYLTNVFTRKEYRNQGIGTALLHCIKEYLLAQKCELIFAWPSGNSVNWYARNGFCQENEIFECVLMKE